MSSGRLSNNAVGWAVGAVAALFIAAGAQGKDDSFSGCWPITPADAAPFNPPSFARYRSSPQFHGRPAPVDLASHPRAKTYRTMLRNGAKDGPNFAGHYTIVGWGCGTNCLQFAIVDASSGAVYFPPFATVTWLNVAAAPGEPEPPYWPLRYRIDSSLLVILGAPGNDDESEGISYYRWDGRKLILVRHLKSLKDRNC